MSITINTLSEEKLRTGKSFLYIYSNLALAAGAEENFIIAVASNPVTIKSITVTADAELMSWQSFGSTQFTENTGVIINGIQRNFNTIEESGITLIDGPTITDDGISFSNNPVDMIAQAGSGNHSYLNQIVVDQLMLAPNSNYLIRFKNHDNSVIKYQLNIDTYNE